MLDFTILIVSESCFALDNLSQNLKVVVVALICNLKSNDFFFSLGGSVDVLVDHRGKLAGLGGVTMQVLLQILHA